MKEGENYGILARGRFSAQRWPIDRTWEALGETGRMEDVRTSELSRYRACSILGAAGLGKTYELRQLADLDRQKGLDVRLERLAALGPTADSLVSRLSAIAAAASTETVIYLDALDEAMVPVKTAGLIVEQWIREELADKQPVLRISCRSAIWPPDVEAALREVYGKDNCAVALLQPLSQADIREIAACREIDPEAFDNAIDRAKAHVLAQQPLTLEMLLRVYEHGGALPASRRELFAQGVEELARERSERLEGGTAVELTGAEILETAERLACFSLLSGREIIDLSDTPPRSSLGRAELESLPSSSGTLEYNVLRAVGGCGLCDSDGSRQFRFGHRQFAEYLAGRTLAGLLPHQAKSILSSGAGWQAGVAGPLRETAAFAAMHSDAIAAWVAENDPEVIGLSDVADDRLRRRATLNLLEKFRRHELTDTQLIRGGIELSGFQYADAEADLKPVLRERHAGCEDVLECAVALIEAWQSNSMSDDLADLMLDANAPLEARKSAGYALVRIGTEEARRRVKPLIRDHQNDPELDLKGLALKCNWPGGLTAAELLTAITTPNRRGYGGAYQGFLSELERSGFDASDARLEGLRWALQFQDRDSDIDSQGRIARRIAIASADELDNAEIADALADVVLAAAKNHAGSPLVLPKRLMEVEQKEQLTPRLEEKPETRRRLIDALAARAEDDRSTWWVSHESPGLVLPEDFPWLLERATSTDISMPTRERYAEFARTIPWRDDVENIDAWLAVRTVEPVASHFPFPVYIELGSEEAAMAKEAYEEEKRWNRPARRPKKLSPSPQERVEQVLTLCETKDARFFSNLPPQLTLEEDSTYYGFSRFLTKTPGWLAAAPETRQRIVDAAKNFLLADSDEPERCRTEPWNRISVAHMAAIWLVMEMDRPFLESLAHDWWERWCWYILRELHPALSEEQNEAKHAVFKLLHTRVPIAVRSVVEELACSSDPDARRLLSSLLGLLSSVDDAELDGQLCKRLVEAKIDGDLSKEVARFVLSRSSGDAIGLFTSCLQPQSVSLSEERSVGVCVALMQTQFSES